MSNIKNFNLDLFDKLNNKYNYAVIRNYEGLPESSDSHDIDILIDKEDYNNFKKDLKELITKHNCKLIMYNKLDIESYIIVKYIDNQIEFVFLDFFFRYSLYSVKTFEAEDILSKREFNGKIFHVNKIYEFLEKYLYCIFLNTEYPKKYSHLFDEVKLNHLNEINNLISKNFEDKDLNITNLEKQNGKSLLKKILIKNIKNKPFDQIKITLNFYFNYIKSKISPNGFSFSMTGPDGSGKTTILTEVESKLNDVYREVKVFHFRPTVIPRIAEVFNKAGLKKEVDVDYTNPHRGGKTSKSSSLFRLFYYIIDYIYGYYKAVKPVLFRRGVVIFDRYYTDIITDSKRSRINVNYKTIFLLKKLVPNMNYNFLIYVDPDKILNRKQELTKDQIVEIYKKLDFLLENDKSFTKIENNENPEIAINEILNFIFEEQHKKYIKKI